MRFLLILVALALAACGPKAPADAAATGDCHRTATRTVAFTAPDARDTIEAHAIGATCDTAVVVWTLRDAQGKPLWAYAGPYAWLSTPADPRSIPEMQTFLERWAGVVVDDTSASPAWPAGSDSAPAGWGPAGHSMFARETYETIRAEKLPRLCVPTSSDGYKCIFYDARAEAVDVHFTGGA